MLRGGARWAVERGYGRPRPRAHRGARRDGRRRPGRCPSGQATPARRDGHARLRQPLPRGAARGRDLRRGHRRRPSGCARATSSSASTAARAAWATRSAPSSCARWRSPRRAAGIALPDRELACAPIRSPVGERYLGAMRAAINCALANRQILTHLTRAGVPRRAAQARSSRCSTTCRTTPARSRRTSSTASRASCTCIARARRGPSARVIPTCRRSADDRPAGADRRQHGHRVVRPRRHARER